MDLTIRIAHNRRIILRLFSGQTLSGSSARCESGSFRAKRRARQAQSNQTIPGTLQRAEAAIASTEVSTRGYLALAVACPWLVKLFQGSLMTTFEVAHTNQQGVNVVVVFVAPAVAHKSSGEQNAIAANLQLCAQSANLAGNIAMVWPGGFWAPSNQH